MVGIDPLAVGTEIRLGRLGRENAATKAMRLLTSGRVLIRLAGSAGIEALVRGDSASMRRVTYSGGAWSCTCPGRGDGCSHIRAVMAVTLAADLDDAGGAGPSAHAQRLCPRCGSGERQRYGQRPDHDPREERHRCYDCGYDTGWTPLEVSARGQ